MINIFHSGGCYYNVKLSYEAMMAILQDKIIEEDYFIEFRFSDDSKGAIRKKHINGICDSLEYDGGKNNV